MPKTSTNTYHRALLCALLAALLIHATAAAQEAHVLTGSGAGPIPDATGVSCGESAVPGSIDILFDASAAHGNVMSLSLDVDLTHSWVGDIDMVLIAPNGAEMLIVSRTGSASPTACGDSTNVDGNYTFSDTEFGNWWSTADLLGASDAMTLGGYLPSNEFGLYEQFGTSFRRSNAQGTWTLRVIDHGVDDTGEVTAAQLTVETNGGYVFAGTGGAPLPDGPSGCLENGVPVEITFDVTGLDATDAQAIELDIDLVHTWLGEIDAILIAPDDTSHVIFGDTGAVADGDCGDSSNLDGRYTFRDAATGDWWASADFYTDGGFIVSQEFRTSISGGENPDAGDLTSIDQAFQGVDPNGQWRLRVRDEGQTEFGSADFAQLTFIPKQSLFTDGFESGDTTAWD